MKPNIYLVGDRYYEHMRLRVSLKALLLLILSLASILSLAVRFSVSGDRVIAEHSNVLTAFDHSRDERFLITGGYDGTVRVWSLSGAELQSEAQGEIIASHLGRVLDLRYSQSGNSIFTAGEDGIVRVLDKGGGVLFQIDAGRPTLAASIALDSKQLLVSFGDSQIQVWDFVARTSKKRIQLANNTCALRVAIMPYDAGFLAMCDDGTIKIWNEDLDIPPSALSGHSGSVQAYAFGKYNVLFSGGDDGKVCKWDLTNKTLRSQSTFKDILSQHADPISSLAYDPKQDRLAIGTLGGRTYLCDSELTIIRELRLQNASIRRLEFLNDRYLLSIRGSRVLLQDTKLLTADDLLAYPEGWILAICLLYLVIILHRRWQR